MTGKNAPPSDRSQASETPLPAGETKRKNTRRNKAVVLALTAVVILPLLAEVACRIWRMPRDRAGERYLEAHPTLYETTRDMTEAYRESLWLQIYVRYRPGASLTVDVGGVPHVVTINSLGYRDREFTVKKPAGTVRIACIGGSTTVQGVRNEETYPALLEKLLRGRFGDRVQVLNLGISGICSDFWLKQPGKLDELLRFEPDIVVQYEGFNDIYHQLFPAYEAQHPVRAWLYHSYLFELCFPIEPRDMEGLFGAAIQNISKMHAILLAHGILHVVGTFARPDASRASAEQRAYFDFNMLYWRQNPAPRWYDRYARLLDRYNQKLAETARGEGWILAPVAQRETDPTKFVDLCHMTPPGIADLAAAFEPEVAKAVDSIRQTRGGSGGE